MNQLFYGVDTCIAQTPKRFALNDNQICASHSVYTAQTDTLLPYTQHHTGTVPHPHACATIVMRSDMIDYCHTADDANLNFTSHTAYQAFKFMGNTPRTSSCIAHTKDYTPQPNYHMRYRILRLTMCTAYQRPCANRLPCSSPIHQRKVLTTMNRTTDRMNAGEWVKVPAL